MNFSWVMGLFFSLDLCALSLFSLSTTTTFEIFFSFFKKKGFFFLKKKGFQIGLRFYLVSSWLIFHYIGLWLPSNLSCHKRICYKNAINKKIAEVSFLPTFVLILQQMALVFFSILYVVSSFNSFWPSLNVWVLAISIKIWHYYQFVTKRRIFGILRSASLIVNLNLEDFCG